jgi:hypothetical protein
MPKELHRKLAAQARKEGYTGKKYKKYVYGTMVNMGWRPKKGKKKCR